MISANQVLVVTLEKVSENSARVKLMQIIINCVFPSFMNKNNILTIENIREPPQNRNDRYHEISTRY